MSTVLVFVQSIFILVFSTITSAVLLLIQAFVQRHQDWQVTLEGTSV